MQIICDTGPVLHLAEVGALDLLKFPDRVLIPFAVLEEIRLHFPNWKSPEWMRVWPLEESAEAQARAWQQAGLIHIGEAHALALAQQEKGDWFLTDDAAARLLADALGIETHGTLGLVLWACTSGLIKRAEAEEVLKKLRHSSLWMSERVFQQAQTALREIAPHE